MVIRMLSFGPVVRVTAPAHFIDLLRRRIERQMQFAAYLPGKWGKGQSCHRGGKAAPPCILEAPRSERLLKGTRNMIEIRGRYNTAICYCDEMDETARLQIQEMCDQRVFAGSKIRIMPDVHAGSGCTIGTTMTIGDRAVPNLVGVDIGCGMETIMLEERRIDFDRLDRVIREGIPSGQSVRGTPHPLTGEIDLTGLRCLPAINLSRALLSLGTLGGGNHFIEVDRDDDGRLYLVIHSGSRNLGAQTANHYQRLGWKALNRVPDERRQALIDRYKAEGREKPSSTTPCAR